MGRHASAGAAMASVLEYAAAHVSQPREVVKKFPALEQKAIAERDILIMVETKFMIRTSDFVATFANSAASPAPRLQKKGGPSENEIEAGFFTVTRESIVVPPDHLVTCLATVSWTIVIYDLRKVEFLPTQCVWIMRNELTLKRRFLSWTG